MSARRELKPGPADPRTRRPQPFVGVHCETVATGTLLRATGCELSEPMLFGLGEALGFVFLNLASLPMPFLGGRSKPFALTQAACTNLGVVLHAEETSSKKKAWDSLERHLGESRPVGLQLDCFHLPYFERPPHFAGHFVAALRLLGDEIEVVDTVQQGSVQRLPRQALESARHARGPMSARARAYTILAERVVDLGQAALTAIRNNAKRYLTPDFGGMGARGLAKLARSLPTWLSKARSPAEDLLLAADLMERAGTGGGLFRNLYRDFLDEAAVSVAPKAKILTAARDGFARSSGHWTAIAELLARCARDGQVQHLVAASELCRAIAEEEVAAMTILARV